MHFSNGTVIDVIQIEGNSEYIELMTRLAKGGEPILIDKGILEKICLKILAFLDYFGLHFPAWSGWRWLNDKPEYTVKDDINILSEMISTLGLAAEERIHHSLDTSRIAITIPDIKTLTPKIINKALRKAGPQSPTDDCFWYPNRLIEADTVYAANGYGLCENYHDLWQCEDEFNFDFEFGRSVAPPASPILLFVSFTRHSLYISITIPNRGQALSWPTEDEKNVFDFDLGLDRILEVDSDHQNALWTSLRERIGSLARDKFRITHLLLAGESATNPAFLDNLRDALAGLEGIYIGPMRAEVPLDSMEYVAERGMNLTFAAARGAALYARRRQEVQCDCSEIEECTILQEKERSDGEVKVDL